MVFYRCFDCGAVKHVKKYRGKEEKLYCIGNCDCLKTHKKIKSVGLP